MSDASIQERLTEVLAAIGQAQLAVQQGHQQPAINRLREALWAGREAMRMAVRDPAAENRDAHAAARAATESRRIMEVLRRHHEEQYRQAVERELAAWTAYLAAGLPPVERDKLTG